MATQHEPEIEECEEPHEWVPSSTDFTPNCAFIGKSGWMCGRLHWEEIHKVPVARPTCR
jgi:hypothetical protein